MHLEVLAPELLQNIIEYLPKEDLKHLRSTCRRLVDCVNHALFDSIFLSVDPRHLVIATQVLQTFGPALRTVVIAPLEYTGLTRFDYDRNLRRSPDMDAKLSSFRPIYKKHRTRAYKWYRALVARQDRAQCEDCLRQVLQNAPNLRKVILVHCNPSITDQELKEICYPRSSGKKCPLNKETHRKIQLSPWHGRVQTKIIRPRVSLHFEGTAHILFNSSNLRAREFIMDGCGKTYDAWAMCYDELPPPVSTMSVFSTHLRKLRLSVGNLPSKGQRARAVGELLSRANGLECLFLTCGRPSSHEDRVDILLSHCRFPKLRTLIVEGGTIQNINVLSIFGGVRNLRRLALEDLRIDRSHWKAFIDEIKSSLDLTSLFMNLLKSGVHWDEDLEVFIDDGNEVENFLHSNPFPDDAVFRTIDSNKVFGRFGDGLPKNCHQFRVAQHCYKLYF